MSLWTSTYEDWDHDILGEFQLDESLMVDPKEIEALLAGYSELLRAFRPGLTHVGHPGPNGSVILD